MARRIGEILAEVIATQRETGKNEIQLYDLAQQIAVEHNISVDMDELKRILFMINRMLYKQGKTLPEIVEIFREDDFEELRENREKWNLPEGTGQYFQNKKLPPVQAKFPVINAKDLRKKKRQEKTSESLVDLF